MSAAPFGVADVFLFAARTVSAFSSPAKSGGINLKSHPAVEFTINLFSYILFVVFQSCSFLKKERKTPAHGKNLRKRPLFTPHTVSPQSGTCSSLQAIACFLGAAELD